MIRDMEIMAGNIAYSFHFPASEIMGMNESDMLFWQGQAKRIDDDIARKSGGKK